MSQYILHGDVGLTTKSAADLKNFNCQTLISNVKGSPRDSGVS